jgi:DNA repair photolyase
VGIARLAHASELLEEKRQVEYRELETRSYLSRCERPDLPFQWMINPYRGCEYGCKYCYARYTHEFMELQESQQFERLIFAKRFNRAEFRRQVRRLPKGIGIGIGTATDPYQPAERRFGILREMLEVLAGERGFRIWITTKSDFIRRDVVLLVELAKNHHFGASITITTLDPALARLTEPYAPRPELRLEAVRALASAGVRVGVGCSPVMPGLNDRPEALDALARAAREAGALWFWSNVLFLKDCSRKVFLPFLAERFPHLSRRYEERYAKAAYLKGEYVDALHRRVAGLKEKYGFLQRGEAAEVRGWLPGEQMTFGW